MPKLFYKLKKVHQNYTSSKGFSYVEVLLVLCFLAVALALMMIALDPAEKFAQARDRRRGYDVQNILDTVFQYTLGEGKSVPDEITESPKMIGTSLGNCSFYCPIEGFNSTEDLCVDLNKLNFDNNDWVPFDPISGSKEITFYAIRNLGSGRMEISACNPETLPRINAVR